MGDPAFANAWWMLVAAVMLLLAAVALTWARFAKLRFTMTLPGRMAHDIATYAAWAITVVAATAKHME